MFRLLRKIACLIWFFLSFTCLSNCRCICFRFQILPFVLSLIIFWSYIGFFFIYVVCSSNVFLAVIFLLIGTLVLSVFHVCFIITRVPVCFQYILHFLPILFIFYFIVLDFVVLYCKVIFIYWFIFVLVSVRFLKYSSVLLIWCFSLIDF